MARRKLIDSVLTEEELQERELNDCVNKFKEIKPLNEKYKRESEELSKNIKDLLDKLNLTCYDVDGFGVTLSQTNSYYFDEDKLIKWLEANGFDECIKSVKVIDNDKLEKLVYNGIIQNDNLRAFQFVKTTKRLLVK